jgi:hypothetical protein
MDKDIYRQKIYFFNEELEKIGRILSNLMDGTGVLLTMAGLLSFLPQLISLDENYLEHFLSWTFWLLLIAIVTYYPASLRVSSIVKGHPFASVGSEMETEILKNRVEYLNLVWIMSVENHDSVMFWNSLTKSFIYGYVFSLTTNLYVFVHYGSPGLCTSVGLLLLSLLLTVILFVFPRIKSQKNKVIEVINK